ncbi:UbiA family prenyltransferase [Candidatus Bathyarchaeota archaeon]|nr:UbiA family prenyltransferase [Candidatus Bathyarchaeota archaeon]MBT4424173.1 UbiA family prenyltransferase [Candidatus Bathyarchaeota archaeon]MBT7187558.1 UbiA family prenyltransferase [Candidatus Bathyarchaeota archaeon]MBT7346092.1 UbiA family prenyltransferase [Candidatus Bathyarchaeota archaeon]
MIACLVVGRGYPPLTPTLMAMGSIFFLTASTYIYNDLCDAEMDRHSDVHSDRPISTGEVSEGFAKGFVVVAAVLGLTISSMINSATLILSASYWVMFTLYSYPGVRFKKMFMVKELVIAIAWPMLALVGVYAVNNTFSMPGVFAGMMMGMFSFLGMPALSDSFDEKEDAMYGIKTMAMALTWKRRVELLGAALVLMIVVTTMTYTQLGFNILLPITIVGSSLLILRSVVPIYQEYNMEKALKVRKLTYIYVIVSQVLIVIGSMNLALPF